MSKPLSATTRLSALDAAFLSYETEHTPAHVGSVAFFEGAPFRDDQGRFRLSEMRSRIESRQGIERGFDMLGCPALADTG